MRHAQNLLWRARFWLKADYGNYTPRGRRLWSAHCVPCNRDFRIAGCVPAWHAHRNLESTAWHTAQIPFFSSFHAYTHTHVSFPCYVYHTGIKVAAEAKPVPHKSFADYCGAVLSFLPSSESWSHFCSHIPLQKTIGTKHILFHLPLLSNTLHPHFSRQNLKVSYRSYANAPSLHFPIQNVR